MDIDGDGTLCQNEVLDIIPAEDLGTLLKEMDQDGDGKIDYGVWYMISFYLFASIAQNWLKEFMTGMEKNLVEPEGKKMLKVYRIMMMINDKNTRLWTSLQSH